jgi:hypothetical protein
MDPYLDAILAGVLGISFIFMVFVQLRRSQSSSIRNGKLVDGSYWGAYPRSAQTVPKHSLDLPSLERCDKTD